MDAQYLKRTLLTRDKSKRWYSEDSQVPVIVLLIRQNQLLMIKTSWRENIVIGQASQDLKRIVIFLTRHKSTGWKNFCLHIVKIHRCLYSPSSSVKGTDGNRLSLRSLSPRLKTWLKDHPAPSSLYSKMCRIYRCVCSIQRFVICTDVNEHPSLSSICEKTASLV